MSTTQWEHVRDELNAAMTPEQRAEYAAAAVEAEARLQLAELVYDAQAPGGVMLARIAHALGGTLQIAA